MTKPMIIAIYHLLPHSCTMSVGILFVIPSEYDVVDVVGGSTHRTQLH